MKKTKITLTEFGKIVEEISASKYDCCMTHIYLNNISDETLSSLKKYVRTLCSEKLPSCMVHWNNEAETLSCFGKEYLVY